jgi:hypothetical protein
MTINLDHGSFFCSFPSTEFYRGSGALVQYELVEASTAAIQALNGCLLPGATQPLLVRYADSPAEKAAKAQRKERLVTRGGALNSLGVGQLALQEQIQQHLLELVSNMVLFILSTTTGGNAIVIQQHVF